MTRRTDSRDPWAVFRRAVLVTVSVAALGTLGLPLPGTAQQSTAPVQPAWVAANGGGNNAAVYALARDPDRPAIRYAGSSTGFARTFDSGATWQAITTGLPPGCQVYSLLAVRRPSGTLLAGCSGSYYADGLYRSLDRGTHWQLDMQGMVADTTPFALLQGPGPAGPLFAAMSDGVYRSDDGARSWQRVLTGEGFTLSAYSLAKDPFSALVYYAATSHYVYKSDDGGFTWFAAGNGLSGISGSSLNQLVADPTQKNRLFLATTDNGVYRSVDGGNSWQSLDNGPGHAYSLLVQPLKTVPKGELTPDLRTLLYPPPPTPTPVAVRRTSTKGKATATPTPLPQKKKPSGPPETALILVGTDSGVQASVDGGADWSDRTSDANDRLPKHATPYVDIPGNATVYALLSFGRSAEVVAGMYPGGVYRSQDLTRSWRPAGPGLTQDLQVNAIALDPAFPGTVYYGTKGYGVEVSSNSGGSLTSRSDGLPGNSVIADLLIQPQRSDRLIAALGAPQGGVAIGDGSSWTRSALGGHFADAVIADPHDPDTLYVGLTRGGVAWSADGGQTWSILNNGLDRAAAVLAIAADPHNALHLLAGTDRGLAMSSDQGASWNSVTGGLPAGAITALLSDPLQRNLFEAGTPSGLYRTVDGGATWTAFGAGLGTASIHRLARDPRSPATLLAATSVGVFRSIDDGANWLPLNVGIPGPSAAEAVASAGPVLYASNAYGVYFQSPTGPVPAAASHGGSYFPAFGHSIQAPFLSFWRAHGGVTVFGYPRSEALRLHGTLVQYFQRVRLEYAPGRGVILTALGHTFTRGRQFGSLKPFKNGPLRIYIPQTKHSLATPFLAFWQAHGGATVFGNPISEVLYEENGDGTGHSYSVQYFQNVRLEYHPENKGTPYEIQLGLLGEQSLRALGWLQ